MNTAIPTVSVGMPVYNGAKYIRQALDSILNQTYKDFEVVICDNASTDDTQSICEDYAKRDPRIRYYRNEKNLGAAPNYNKTFKLARGRYFNWFAHDDLFASNYLEQCVMMLEANPDTVLCSSVVSIIDENGDEVTVYKPKLSATESSSSVAARFAPMVLVSHTCTDFFGLFRTELLGKTGLHGVYHGCDRALLAEIALMGKIMRIPEPAFANREHTERYSRAIAAGDRSHWHDSRSSNKIGFVTWKLYFDYIKAIRARVPSTRERFRCYRVLLKWWTSNLNSLRLLADLVIYIAPSSFGIAEKIKDRLIKPQYPLAKGQSSD